MLLKLITGDLVDSSDIASVKAKQAICIPDRLEIELGDGQSVVVPCQDLEEALALRDELVESIDAAGECIVDRSLEDEEICPECGLPMDEHDDIDLFAPTGEENEEMEVECPHCGEPFTCEVYGDHYCPECGEIVEVVPEEEMDEAE